MRSESPTLLPIFRSQPQAELLSILFLHPERDYTATELSRRLGIPLSTLHREAQRLEDAELITSRKVGRARLLRANSANRLFKPLTHLLTATFGPHAVVAEEFGGLPDVERLLIYGSWAARYRGEVGPPPNDIDVLLVGRPNRFTVYDAADRAQERLGIPVNPMIFSPTRWSDPNDGLVQQIRSSPMLDLTNALMESHE
jgi:DNA-binding transcriptional ArsR family regulator